MAEQTNSSDLATAFPDHPFFESLLKSADKRGDRVMIDDSDRGIVADYNRFFRDVVSFRQKIGELLPPEVMDENGFVREDKEAYICALFPASYYSMVAFIATVSIRAVSVALCKANSFLFPDFAQERHCSRYLIRLVLKL